LQQYLLHYHEERNHQGKENRILFPFQLWPPLRGGRMSLKLRQSSLPIE